MGVRFFRTNIAYVTHLVSPLLQLGKDAVENEQFAAGVHQRFVDLQLAVGAERVLQQIRVVATLAQQHHLVAHVDGKARR